MESLASNLVIMVVTGCYLATAYFSRTDFAVTLNAESQNVQDGLLARLFFDSNCMVPNNQLNTCPNTVMLSIDNVPYDTQRCVTETVYVKVSTSILRGYIPPVFVPFSPLSLTLYPLFSLSFPFC